MSTRAAEIRAGLGHPVIDADAHINEFYPGFLVDREKKLRLPYVR